MSSIFEQDPSFSDEIFKERSEGILVVCHLDEAVRSEGVLDNFFKIAKTTIAISSFVFVMQLSSSVSNIDSGRHYFNASEVHQKHSSMSWADLRAQIQNLERPDRSEEFLALAKKAANDQASLSPQEIDASIEGLAEAASKYHD